MATSSIYAALLAAQKEMGPLLKNATNPHFRNRYADLSAVIETISEPLNNAGLVFYQGINYDATNNVSVLTTVVADTKSGETLESHFPIVCKDPQNPQAIGGAITYLRRYSLMAMLGLAPEDDDGHAASQRPQPKTENKPAPRKEPEQFVDTTTGEIEEPTPRYDGDEARASNRMATEKQVGAIYGIATKKGYDREEVHALIDKRYSAQSTKDLTVDQASDMIDFLQGKAS